LTIPVKLPKEVLNLFPTWEYRCPDCSTYIESNISFCPNCKTAFDEKRWRVPPRFLKSHKSMSEYAHKVLAPKLTPKQRELLFHYFTELFSDGFESGDFSAWTGTSGSPSVVGSPVHHGSYAAEFDTDGEYVQKTFTATSAFYCRFYIRVSAVPTSNGEDLCFLTAIGTAQDVIRVYFIQVGGIVRFRIRFEPTSTNYDYYWTPSTDTWYCIEVGVLVDGSNGEVHGYVDGSHVINQTGLDTDDYGDIQDIKIGSRWLDFTCTVNIDCVAVADTYIGPESMEQTYTKTWTTDALFKKLAIPKAFSVDTALQKQNIPKTFGLDSTFQKSFVTQKQLDVLFKKLDILETFGVDVDYLKRNVVKSFAVDARFGALMTQTISRQIDVLLKKLDATKTFGLDACFGPAEAETCMRDFALDAIFAYKVRLPELWLDENGKLVLNISKPYTWVGT
jgi:hypothetical protein